MIQVASHSDQHERDDGTSPLRESQDLRWIAAAFESAQAQRLRLGDQIRAQSRVGLASEAIAGNVTGGEPREARFAEIILRRRPTLEIAAVAWKRASSDNAGREALLDALQL